MNLKILLWRPTKQYFACIQSISKPIQSAGINSWGPPKMVPYIPKALSFPMSEIPTWRSKEVLIKLEAHSEAKLVAEEARFYENVILASMLT